MLKGRRNSSERKGREFLEKKKPVKQEKESHRIVPLIAGLRRGGGSTKGEGGFRGEWV